MMTGGKNIEGGNEPSEISHHQVLGAGTEMMDMDMDKSARVLVILKRR
jgi:hypothetical protein